MHRCDIRSLVIGKGSLDAISEATEPFGNILIVADSNTYPLCGERVSALLSDKLVGVCLFETEGHLVPDEEAIIKIEAALDEKRDLILGIGSGVINDLCKYVSFYHGIKSGIIATASPESLLTELSDSLVYLPTPTKDTAGSGTIMGTLFEQALLLFGDLTVEALGDDVSEMRKRHANLE